MAGGKEREGKGIGVEFSRRFRDAGIVIALLGIIGLLAKIRFSEEVTTTGAFAAVVGQSGVTLFEKK